MNKIEAIEMLIADLLKNIDPTNDADMKTYATLFAELKDAKNG